MRTFPSRFSSSLELTARDVQFAVRLLIKDRRFTIAAVLALGLGIGVNNSVFTLVNTALIRDLPFERPGELVLLRSVTNQGAGPPRHVAARARRIPRCIDHVRRSRRVARCDHDDRRGGARSRAGARHVRVREPVPAARAGAGARPHVPAGRRPARRAGRCGAGRQSLAQSLRRRSPDRRADGARQRRAGNGHRRDGAPIQVPVDHAAVAAAVGGPGAHERSTAGRQSQRHRPARAGRGPSARPAARSTASPPAWRPCTPTPTLA